MRPQWLQRMRAKLRSRVPQWPVTGLIVVRVTGEKAGKVAVGALPEEGFARITCPVDVHAPEAESELERAIWERRQEAV